MNRRVLERGSDIQHGKDYRGEHAPSWKMPFYGMPNRECDARDYPIQSQCYAFSDATVQYWNNDRLNPYVRNEEKPFIWTRADEIDNLIVTDGSFMTSASCVNPSLSYMAFTARACDYAVKQLKAGGIGA